MSNDAFDQADTEHQQAFTDRALAADQMPTAGHDQQPPETPARFLYPNPGPGGRLGTTSS